MIANYHTHTHRCNHAIGREEDYVKEALKVGLKILGWAVPGWVLFPLPDASCAAAGLCEDHRGPA